MIQLESFSKWLRKLRDSAGKAAVLAALLRLVQAGDGDVKALGDGLLELRIHRGPGYRVYFAAEGEQLVLLIAGGDKDSQPRDIKQARTLLAKWKEIKR